MRRAQTAAPLPSAAAVARLLPAGTGNPSAGLLVALVTLTVVAIAVLARAGVPVAGLIAVPLAGTALVATAASALDAATRSTTYADMVSGDRMARFVRVVRIEGGAPATVTVPVDTGWLRATSAGDLNVVADGPFFDEPRVTIEAALLAQRDIVMVGSRPLDHPLHLDLSGAAPRIANAGDTRVTGAILSWRGTEYALPVIAPGEVVTASADLPAAEDGTARRLLRARAEPALPALIAPLAPESGDGWVLMRSGEGAAR